MCGCIVCTLCNERLHPGLECWVVTTLPPLTEITGEDLTDAPWDSVESNPEQQLIKLIALHLLRHVLPFHWLLLLSPS